MTKPKGPIIAADPNAVEAVARIVSDADDRGWVVCSHSDCHNSLEGRCTIFAIKGVAPMKPGQPCADYARIHGGT